MSVIENSSKLPLYLKKKNEPIVMGSLVVNPYVDFTIYQVVLICGDRMMIVDENMKFFLYKTNDFVNVDYVFNVNTEAFTKDNVGKTIIELLPKFFNHCEELERKNPMGVIFQNHQEFNILNQYNIDIDIKLIMSKNKCKPHEIILEDRMGWLEHYSTIKTKDSKSKIYIYYVLTSQKL